MENIRDPQTRTESKTRLIERIKTCVHSGDYSRALDLLRGTAAEFPEDAERSELEQLAQDGIRRNAEANRLITESQELFAQRKSSEAILLLREAYELDKNNSLARTILANALVEHAHSLVETDWWEAETLAKQALALNPAHPTAKTIRSIVVDRKKAGSVEEWAAQARKLQSSGDLFASLACVAEGLDVHPDDPQLLQIQDAVQRDQSARRRQSRRHDLADLRRMEREIDGTVDVAAKQALAERIQAVAAKHWTDGEILSVANGLLNRLGLVPPDGSTASPQSKGATVIFHVPRPSVRKVPPAGTGQDPTRPVVPSVNVPRPLERGPIAPENFPTDIVPPREVLPSIALPGKVPSTTAGSPLSPPPAATVAAVESSAPAEKITPPAPQPKRSANSPATALILVSFAAVILVAATFFFTRKHYAPPVATMPSAAPTDSAVAASAPRISAPAVSVPAQATPEPSPPAVSPFSETAAGNVTPDEQGRADFKNGQRSGDTPGAANLGALVVVAGEDNARVSLNGILQPQLTQSGQLRLPNLEFKDYVVQVSKSGFQDPPQQKIRIRKGELAKLIFDLKPQPSLASLAIQGGAPETMVFVDQTFAGTVHPDGTLAISTVKPGDHTVELRKERFTSRQFKKHFMAGGTIFLPASDAALEAAPGELKITYAPADATVAIAKGDLLKTVSSGVPLNLTAGTYTLTARTAERFTRSATFEIVAGQSKTLDLSLAPSGMSKWDDPGAWKQERDSFVRTGGNFVLYGTVPTVGTFAFAAMPTKGHLLQWVFNYSDPKNYVLFQIDDDNFYRTVIRNGEKTDELKVPDKGDKKSFRTLQIRVSPTQIIHQIKHGEHWTVLDRWTLPGANLGLGKFGFYLPGNDQVALSGFAHYAELNIR